MQRTTKPDSYSTFVRGVVRQFRTGAISRATFANLISLVWKLRGNA